MSIVTFECKHRTIGVRLWIVPEKGCFNRKMKFDRSLMFQTFITTMISKSHSLMRLNISLCLLLYSSWSDEDVPYVPRQRLYWILLLLLMLLRLGQRCPHCRSRNCVFWWPVNSWEACVNIFNQTTTTSSISSSGKHHHHQQHVKTRCWWRHSRGCTYRDILATIICLQCHVMGLVVW